MLEEKRKLVTACVIALGVAASGVAGWRHAAAAPEQPPPAAAKQEPRAPAEDPRIQALRDRLGKPVTHDGFDPGTPLHEAVAALEKDFHLKITYDPATGASRLAKLKKTPIGLPRMVNTPLYRVLDLLLSQVALDGERLRHRLRAGGVELTTARGAAVLRGARLPPGTANQRAAACLKEMREKLDTAITIDGFERNTPLKECVGFLCERYGMTMYIRSEQFRRIGIHEAHNQPLDMSQQVGVPFELVLQKLAVPVSARVRLRSTEVEFIPRTDLHAALVFSPDGQRLATVSSADSTSQLIRVWDRASGREREKVIEDEVDVAGIAFTADSKRVVTLARDARAPSHGRLTSREIPVARSEITRLNAAGPLVLASDGRKVAWAAEGKWHLYNADTRAEETAAVSLAGPLAALHFADEGRMVVGIDQAFGPTAVAIWKPAAASITRFRLDARHGGDDMPCADIAVSRDGRLLAALDLPGRASVWELATGRRIRRLASPAIIQDVALSPDGSLLAGICELAASHTVEVWRLHDGKALCRLRGSPDDPLLSLAFAPDGKTLAACADDGTPVLWDVSDLYNPSTAGLTADRLEKLWSELLVHDPGQAYPALLALGDHPEQAVPFLAARLRARKQVDAARNVETVLRDLDHDEFARRNQAEKMLLEMGKDVEPRLRKELAGTLPSLEARRRIERILERLQEPIASPQRLREVRAVQALERAGTAAAAGVLEELARGSRTDALTNGAAEAHARLSKQRAR